MPASARVGHAWLLAAACAALALGLPAATAPGARATVCTSSACQLSASTVGEDPSGGGVFRFPQAISFTPGGGAVFVGDEYSSVVQKFDRSGNLLAQFGWRADRRQLARFGVIGGIATDRNNHVYVLDSENDRVQVFRSEDAQFLGAWGTHGSAAGQFDLGSNTNAGGIAVYQPDPATPPLVYIADQRNGRVQVFTIVQPDFAGERVFPPGSTDPTGSVIDVPAPLVAWGSRGACVSCTSPASAYTLDNPAGIAVDPQPDAAGQHDVFVADDDNQRVVEYGPTGGFVAIIGSEGIGVGQFEFPYDVGVDNHSPNYLYVLDNNNHRVQEFTASDRAFQRTWGGFGPGPSSFEYPRALGALADDPTGGVDVADNANDMVKAFDTSGNPLAAWGIAGRGPGYFTRPDGAASAPDGSLYVADTLDQRIEKFAPDGTYVDQFGLVSQASGFAAPGAGPGQFDHPTDVAYDPVSGNLWVTDTANDRVQELTSSGGYLGEVDGLSSPEGITVDSTGTIYIAETGNNRVLRLTGAGLSAVSTSPLVSPAAVAPGPAGSLYVADAANVYNVPAGGGAATALPAPPGGFNRPAGLAFDGSRLYVADTSNSRVLRLPLSSGAWETVGAEDNQAGGFLDPRGLALSPAGTLFVADTANNRVQRLDPPGVTPPPRGLMSVVHAGSGSGGVSSAPAGISCPTDCRQYFGIGHGVTLTATPNLGSVFAGWQGGCAGAGAAPTCSLGIAGPTGVIAVFNRAPVAPPPPPPPPPRVSITRLHLSSRVLHQRPVRRRRHSRILVDFSLSAPGSVITQVQKSADGRRSGSRCVRTTRSDARHRRCTRFVALRGQLTTRVRLRGRLMFTGTVGRRRLKLGRYRFQFTPLSTDRRPGVLRYAAFSVRV